MGELKAAVLRSIVFLLAILSIPLVSQSQGFIVDSLNDDTIAGDNLCTLREAIESINGSGNGDCQDQGGAPEISFAVSGEIVLSTPDFPMVIDSDVLIDGNGQIVIEIANKTGVFEIAASRSVVISNIELDGGQLFYGMADEAVLSFGTLQIKNAIFRNLKVESIVRSHGPISIIDSSFLDNFATVLWSDSITDVNTSKFINNRNGSPYQTVNAGCLELNSPGLDTVRESYFEKCEGITVGAIWKNEGSLLIEKSTFTENWAILDDPCIPLGCLPGGGGDVNDVMLLGTELVIENSTFSIPNTESMGNTESVRTRSTQPSRISSSTFNVSAPNRTCGFSVGLVGIIISSEEALLSVDNTIMNDATCRTFGNIASGGHNFIRYDSDANFVDGLNNDIVGQGSAYLGPLSDNGGFTPTFAPSSTSPVLDAGDCPGESADQRGINNNGVRVEDLPGEVNVGDGCDIGAVEKLFSELPVELSAFSVTFDGVDEVALSWTTLSEENNAGFEIHHKGPSNPLFNTISFINGRGSTSEKSNYDFKVYDPEVGVHYFQLVQIDYDGARTPSQLLELSVELIESFKISGPYPNPATQSTAIDIVVRESQTIRSSIFDLNGKLVAILSDEQLSANVKKKIRLEHLNIPAGMYFIKVEGESFTKVVKFSVPNP